MRPERRILLFDGICNLCNGLVQFTIQRDPNKKFLFATLQSINGKNILKKYHLPPGQVDTFVFVEGEKCFIKSSAGLHVLKLIGGFWALFYVFILVPAPIRDWVYDRMAQSRYRIFGRRERCMVPTPELIKRFLK